MYIYKTHSTEVVCAFILGSRFSDHSQDGFEKKIKYINIKPCCMNIRYKHTNRINPQNYTDFHYAQNKIKTKQHS